MQFLTTTVLSLFFASLALAQSPGVTIAFQIKPAGSFEAKSSSIKGNAKKAGAGVTAQGIVLPLASLTTGMGLRDNHMKDKYLEVKKYPNAEVVTAQGANGKGKATIKIRGVAKEWEGSYRVISDKLLEATFTIKLSDYNITGIRYLGAGVKDEAQVVAIVPLTP